MELLLDTLEETLRVAVKEMMVQTRQEVHRMLQEVTRVRDIGVREVSRLRAELAQEVSAMQKVQAAHLGRVVLDIGGVEHVTSVATLRSRPGTMLDAMFSGNNVLIICLLITNIL